MTTANGLNSGRITQEISGNETTEMRENVRSEKYTTAARNGIQLVDERRKDFNVYEALQSDQTKFKRKTVNRCVVINLYPANVENRVSS
jgi:hypothetical protein